MRATPASGGILFALLTLAACGGNDTGLTGPSMAATATTSAPAQVAGKYTLVIRPSAACNSLPVDLVQWPVVAQTTPYAGTNLLLTTISQPGGGSDVNASLTYGYDEDPPAADGIIDSRSVTVRGTAWTLYTIAVIHGRVSSVSGRGAFSGFLDGELVFEHGNDQQSCLAGNHEITIRPRS